MKRAISSIAIIALSVTLAAGFGATAGAQSQNPSNPARDQSATPGRAHGNYSNPHAGSQDTGAAPGDNSGSSTSDTGANSDQTNPATGSSGSTARSRSAVPGRAHGNYSNPHDTGNSNR